MCLDINEIEYQEINIYDDEKEYEKMKDLIEKIKANKKIEIILSI